MDTRFQANENDETAVSLIKKSSKRNNFELLKRLLYLGGRFRFILPKHYPGAMFGLGSGTHASLHNQTMISRRYY
jgi:hypothetical protein